MCGRMHLQYLIVWETCSREDGYFLASGNAVHAIDGGYASLDHLLRVDTTLRVYRLTCNMRTTQAGNSGVSLCASLHYSKGKLQGAHLPTLKTL